jgi:hypothetical protein
MADEDQIIGEKRKSQVIKPDTLVIMQIDGIRSMFGHHSGLGRPDNALGDIGDKASPWGGSAANSDLARDAGTAASMSGAMQKTLTYLTRPTTRTS